jgi:Zn-dependent protease
MRAQLRIARVAGIPVGANWSLVVIFGLLAYVLATSVLPATVDASRGACWAAGIIVAPLFFAALLEHELAHALVARLFGVQVKRINLWMLGGVTEFAGEPSRAR